MVRKIGFVLLLILVLLLLVPALIVRSCSGKKSPEIEGDPYIVAVWNHKSEELMHIPLGEYLSGVVAAEMPVSFHLEALKAQAIVARTYTLAQIRKNGGGGCDRHPEADVCTDSTHCQAWVSKDEAVARWPFLRQRSNWRKILSAVSETEALVVVYQGKLIDAVYHSTCGGSTENSEDVWTNNISYLRSVDCGFCNNSPRYTETVQMEAGKVAEQLGVPQRGLNLKVVKRSDKGRIIEIDIGGEIIRGLEFRKRLGLKSSKVSWLQEGNQYSFTTVGYGHAVGLCQYGADGMALNGYLAEEIIEKYYTGVQIIRMQVGE